MMQPGDNPPRVDLQTLPYSYLSTNLSSKLSNAIFVIFRAYYCYLLLLSAINCTLHAKKEIVNKISKLTLR